MDHGINYTKQDVVAEVMKLTDNKGVDLVVDPVGGSTLAEEHHCRSAIAGACRWWAMRGARIRASTCGR